MAEILLVEDNPGDVLLAKKAFARAEIAHDLIVVSDGEQALDYLFQRGAYTAAPAPALVLLDLNLPSVTGLEVLREIKSTAGLRRLPVIVVTASEADQDIERAFDLHANSYVTKPLDFHQFVRLVGALKDWWLVLGKLPALQ